VLALVASFALFVASHVALAVGLTLTRPRWRGPVALVVLPLAPYWGHGAGMHVRAALWLASAVVYALARVAVSF
jgi:hypothetical protein